MYAIAFDLDTELLQQVYPGPSWRHGYDEMRAIVEAEGFSWRQGSVYFGDATVDPVKCVLVTQRLARELTWFTAAVRDMRMLRIEENNDLGRAVTSGS